MEMGHRDNLPQEAFDKATQDIILLTKKLRKAIAMHFQNGIEVSKQGYKTL